jgi:hypothetical protein
MKEQIEIYLQALALAKKIIAEKKASKGEKPKEEGITVDPLQGKLDI